jgi:DNA helicase-2/ATP-dependent DNA helicase PcrA
MNLTDSQRRAIEHAGRNLQLIACAGSGKTEVVARRVVHLLTRGRADSLVPRNIVRRFFDSKTTPNIKAALEAEADPEAITLELASEPFPVRGYERIAVKVADVYGNESAGVRDLP